MNKLFSGAAIQITDLTKQYKEVTAVDSLDLSVMQGEIFGFLGRNGAGKTTTIRMILGLIRPNRGRVLLFGKDVAAERMEAVSQVGSLVETATYYPTLTVRENLDIQCRLTGSPKASVERSIELLGLVDMADRCAGHLSLGNKQRLALARAILPGPHLLVLDEPSNALDPAGIVEIRHLLRRLSDEEGVTIFVSSHMLSEIAQLTDRIAIIHKGRLIEEVSASKTLRENPGSLELRVSDPERAYTLLKATPGAGEVRSLENGVLETTGGTISASAMARLIVESGIELESLCPKNEDLETRFMRLTGGE